MLNVNGVPTVTPGPAILQIFRIVGLKMKFAKVISEVDRLTGMIACPVTRFGFGLTVIPCTVVPAGANPVDDLILAIRWSS